MSTEETDATVAEALAASLNSKRAAFARDPNASYATRLDRLDRLSALVKSNESRIIDALDTDFGCRSRTETVLAEIMSTQSAIRYARRNLRKWMRRRGHHTSFWSQPAKVYAQAQPLGVVGIMAPWNYSLDLSLSPLSAALAAGNRVMLSMSEETPSLCALLQELFAQTFAADEVSVFQGGAVLSPAFARLPFDHLLFTGSTRVGRLVAQAAATNLTPVTLELGGKSPAIVAPDFDVTEAAARIGWGKGFNAGQTCAAPDYVFVPAAVQDAFAEAVLDKFAHSYASMEDSDLTAIISERFYRRLEDLIAEAEAGGAQILRPEGYAPIARDGVFKMPMTVVLNAPLDCRLMAEEIFGPVLPVLTYESIGQVIDYVNERDRPLSLYVFSHDRRLIQRVQQGTVSGSLGVNETLLQYIQEDLAFGGVGSSGQGAYHGQAGFDTFSHLKSVFVQQGLGHLTGIKLLHPPYGPVARFLIRLMKN